LCLLTKDVWCVLTHKDAVSGASKITLANKQDFVLVASLL